MSAQQRIKRGTQIDMKRYIAFLRGVNISGRNKVTMAELKQGVERLGYEEVKTYLNSGNVIFSSDENDIGSISKRIVMMIKKQFDLEIPVFVIAKEELEDILRNAPDWWGNDDKDGRHCQENSWNTGTKTVTKIKFVFAGLIR